MEDASSSFLGGTSSFVILCVSIVGIMSTTLLMLAYYLFLTRCGLLFFWRADQSISVVTVTVHEEAPPHRSGGGGLEEAAIRRIPTFRYRSGHDDAKKQQQQQQECAVCLGDFGDGERLRLLPPCRHAFHIDCIDAWLHATATCPLCRAAVVVADVDDVVVIDIVTAEDAEAAAEQPHSSSSSSSSLPLPLRRSLSMDSSTDKRFYLALQRIIQHQQHSASPAATQQQEAKGDSAAAAARSSRRLRRSFFSFSQSRGSRSAILPL
ncbi:unnamed protein product [Urochloa humidicola]